MENRDIQFAVAWINWFDYVLKIEFIYAKNWKEAAVAHSNSGFKTYEFDEIPDDIEEAKQLAFDGDAMFDVVEI